jgi:hypothetical protein
VLAVRQAFQRAISFGYKCLRIGASRHM